jgi:hypothetical protein
VFGAIQVLGSRLSLLEPSHLDHVEGRLAALHQKMSAIADKKQVLILRQQSPKPVLFGPQGQWIPTYGIVILYQMLRNCTVR